MGLSAYPTPADVGILCMILFNAADLISIFRNFFFSTLQIVGIKIHPSKLEEEEEQDQQQNYSSSFVPCNRGFSNSENSIFKKMIPVMKYYSLIRSNKHKEECSICLTELEANSMINQLSCGHFFHSHCLDTWLRYWYSTCPLCRTQIALQEQE